jgi:phosphatidylinositol alpha-1,6-mannosyltransferase
MKKTLLVTIDFPPAMGGVAAYWDRVCSSLQSDKLLVLTNNPEAVHETAAVIKKQLLFKKIWPKWLKGIIEIYKTYKQHDCEQILVGQILPVGSMALVLHRLFGIKYLVQVYGMDVLQAKNHSRKEKLAKKIIQHAQGVIVNSKTTGKIVEEFGVTKYTVVYPITKPLPEVTQKEIEALKQKYNLQDKKIILSIGRLVKRKGFDKTLGAMKHVWQKYPDAVYIIAGDGEEREALEKMAEPHKEHVLILGKVSEQERNTLLATCDIFIMPSRKTHSDVEGFGMVYVEAHQYKKPVIAGNTGGAVEAVLDRKTGLIVDPEDIDAIAEGILELLDNPELAKQLGEAGKKRLSEGLSWDIQKKKLEEIL